MEAFVFWVFIALLAGWSGYNRTIGFWSAFVLSFLLGPIGWLFIFFSRRVYLTQGYNEQESLKVSIEQEESEDVDEKELKAMKKEMIAKLLDEWSEGKITEQEYKIKKERIKLL